MAHDKKEVMDSDQIYSAFADVIYSLTKQGFKLTTGNIVGALKLMERQLWHQQEVWWQQQEKKGSEDANT